MKQLSLIILMWFSTLYLNAQQKFDIELFPISVYSNDRENYHERHRMPSKKPLKVFCEDGMIHFTNVPTSCRIVFKNEQGEILCQFSFNATFFTIEKPASAACLRNLLWRFDIERLYIIKYSPKYYTT